MDRLKQELTGHDFDQLFDDVSSDNATFITNILSENYHSFRLFAQQQAVDVHQRLLNDTNMNTIEPDRVGSAAFLHAGCPPPRMASAAAVDDIVIKLLGDTGGTDEHFWNSLQVISSENSFQRASTSVNHTRTGVEACSSQNDITLDVDGPTAEPETPSSSSSSAHQDDALELIKKYGSSLIESFAHGDKPSVYRPKLGSSDETARLIRSIQNITSTSNSNSNSTTINKNASETTQSAHPVYNTRNTTRQIATTQQPVTLLGKRGRYFLDVWDEEDYLSRIRTTTNLRPLYNWSELFHSSYADNHDGCYRDWLVNCQEAAKVRLNDPKFKKNKKRSSDPIFRHDGVEKVDNQGLAALIPPPVPVAIQHPASWAIREIKVNEKNAKNVSLDVHTMHPASVTSRTVYPVHQKNLHSIRTAMQAQTQIDCNKVSEVEDVDDFNIYTDRLQRELQAIEVTNFVRLSRLSQSLQKHSALSALQNKRKRLEELVLRAAGAMEPTSADRVVYAFKPHRPPPAVQQAIREHKWSAEENSLKPPDVLKLDVWGNEIKSRQVQEDGAVNQQSRYNTRCADSTISASSIATASMATSASASAAALKVDALKYRRELVGACSARQLAQGTALLHSQLLPDTEIEVCLNKVWQVATICRVVGDGDHVRHVKVTPQDCTALESVWLSVEDGKIAPYGTHLRPIIPHSNSISKNLAAKEIAGIAIDNRAGGNNSELKASLNTKNPIVSDSLVGTRLSSHVAAAAPVPPAVRSLHPDAPNSTVQAAISLASIATIATADTNTNQNTSKQSPASSSMNTNNTVASAVHSAQAQPSGLMVSDPRLRKISPSIQHYHTPTLSNNHHHALNGFPHHNGMIALPARSNVPVNSSYAYAGSILMNNTNYTNNNYHPNSNNLNYHNHQASYTNGMKVKLGLPLGATDKRELIAAVNAYTPLPMHYAAPYANTDMNGVHGAHAEHAPQPFNPYTRGRFGQVQETNMPPHAHLNSTNNGHTGPVPFAYEYEGAGEVNHRPVFDTVGYHHLPMNGHIGVSTGVSRVQSESTTINNNNNNVNAHAPEVASAPATTFRLGKKGQITRN